MQKPILAIMAAGIGSRYGGCKQIDPMDAWGSLIIDFSIYDALRAGFTDVLFIIKHEIEADFREAIGDRIARFANISYAFQELHKLPAGFEVPSGREKPWGTTHAVLCAADAIGERAFAAINADDYYGPMAYQLIYDFLTSETEADAHAMVGYPLANTLTDYGHVSRGVCEVDEAGLLTQIVERLKIVKTPEGCAYMEGGALVPVPQAAIASMNFWGFSRGMLPFLRESFAANLEAGLMSDPKKYEDLLPNAVQKGIAAGRAQVRVLPTKDRWFGVTYAEDKPSVMANIQALKTQGVYPEKLW